MHLNNLQVRRSIHSSYHPPVLLPSRGFCPRFDCLFSQISWKEPQDQDLLPSPTSLAARRRLSAVA